VHADFVESNLLATIPQYNPPADFP